MSFRPIAQPDRTRPHVEIRGRKMTVAPFDPTTPPNAFAAGANSLLKAVTDQKLEEQRAAQAADPWSGLREASSPSPFAGLGSRLRGLFGLGV